MNAILVPSGDQAGCISYTPSLPPPPHSPVSPDPSAFMMRNAALASDAVYAVNAIRRRSGDQAGSRLSQGSLVSRVGWLPSVPMVQIAQVPSRWLAKAISPFAPLVAVQPTSNATTAVSPAITSTARVFTPLSAQFE